MILCERDDVAIQLGELQHARQLEQEAAQQEIDRLRAALVDQQRQREELELKLEQAVVSIADAKEGIRIDELVTDPCAVHAEDRT